MSNTYQKDRRHAQPDRLPGEVAVPEQVIVSMAEIAESAREGLLALAVGTGMQVMAAMFGEDAGRLCGPDGKHNADRAGYRHGSGAGSVTLGGRRLPVTRPRVRAADGSGELHLPSYDLFSSTEVLGQLALERMLAGLSSRRYRAGLEPAGQAVDQAAAATSKSAVSRPGAHPDYVSALLAANGDATVLTEAFSVGWPDAPHRVPCAAVAAAEAFDGGIICSMQNPDGPVTLPRLAARTPSRESS